MQSGTLLGIAIRFKSRAPIEQLDEGVVSSEHGISGDFRGKTGGRQVTVLSKEAWDAACNEMGCELPWTTRRANLLVEGLTLAERTGSLIRIGSVVLRINGETKPCDRMEEQSVGLRKALTPDWRGGVCCDVVKGGTVSNGQEITLESAGTMSDE